MKSNDLKERLIAIAQESSWLKPALVAVRSLNLSSWCIGAGAVRNLVWDSLHQLEVPSSLSDVDVRYFDASDCSGERDAQLQRRLTDALASTTHPVPAGPECVWGSDSESPG